jgi:PhnB protein
MLMNPYLPFNGDCEVAIKFYERSLGAKIEMLLTHAESPLAADTPPEWLHKILHARLTIDGNTLMASDSPPGHYREPQGIWVSLGIGEPAEAERIFAALAENGEVVMPIGETFWAYRFGMLFDQFKIPWMINCEKPA